MSRKSCGASGGNRSSHMAVWTPAKAAPIGPSANRLVPLCKRRRCRLRLSPKTCREHASKCTQTAETFPPGEQRQKFLDMAADWTRLAASIEDLEASFSRVPANANEPYRFGSRIDAQQSHTAEEEAAT